MPSLYRADHVGSFLRPAELLDARCAQRSPAEIQILENRHILRVLEQQKKIGFEIFTDGEFRRTNFMSDFTDAVEGFDFGDTVRRAWQTATVSATPASRVAGVVTAKLRQLRRLTAHELP